MNRSLVASAIVLSLFAGAAFTAGCSTPKEQNKFVGLSDARTLSDQLTAAQTRLKAVMDAANKMDLPSVDTAATVDRFTRELAQFQSEAAAIQQQAGLMRQQGESYFAKWGGEVASGKTDGQGAAEMRESRDKYRLVKQYLNQAGDQYRELMPMLNSVRDGLAGGGKPTAFRSVIEKANKAAGDLSATTDNLIREINAVAGK